MVVNVKQKSAVVDKWKKKRKFSLVGSKHVGNMELGETVAEKPETLIGRNIRVNMGSVLNQARKKNVDLTFKVSNVQGSSAQTDLVGYELKASYLRRLFRRRSSKIENVMYVYTKDQKKIKVKAVIVTLRKVEQDKRATIRKIMLDTVTALAKDNNMDAFMSLILERDLFEGIIPQIKKISGVRKAELEQVKQVA